MLVLIYYKYHLIEGEKLAICTFLIFFKCSLALGNTNVLIIIVVYLKNGGYYEIF